MAEGLLLKSGSPLIGSPITYQVTAARLSDNCSFHRVKLSVTAALSVGADSGTTLTLSTPADSGEVLLFDISSALRAVADRYQYEPTPPAQYPYVTYSLSACDEYMKNGEIHDNVEPTFAIGGRVLLGAYTDYERFISGGNKLAQHFTRKPQSLPEIVAVGETMVCPRSFLKPLSEAQIDSGPTSEVVAISSEGWQAINGRWVFALPAGQRDRYQFRFVNSLGCLESVSVATFRNVEVNCTTETFIRAVQQTFGSSSRGFVTKTDDYETWKMSTPPLDELWQAWFIHEFLMAKYVWILIDEHWIPCHLIPEDTINGVNKAESSLLSVSFSVRLDINGSPLSGLAV